MAQKSELKFSKDGKFKIVQFTDVHFKYGNRASDIALERINQVSVSAILSCRPFFILIFLLCIKMKHYGFSRKSIWKNLETFP